MPRTLPLLVTTALLVPSTVPAQDSAASAQVKRGEYLVSIAGCHDCHTPWVMGSDGPEPDLKRALSGHPQDLTITAPASVSPPWSGAMTPTSTGWSGPWGVSFSANLTPDPETGVLSDFTEQQFIQTIRTGRHQGQGRQILPPMPWPAYSKMTDDDLKAVFAYLRQIPPVKNKVPDPLPPKQ
ncbi:c-type cytochrome [Microvirga aerilata]|uniref:C-type cytochrome n=1 Tax=Microvirga aerilata TaxID=670292 RepID=A0A936ZDX0_9HYPH|nr:c-type cytochrome [Microvirga aerilata]MBL0402668.1 c-type cytochrome [Microvirga aerilata]